MKDMGRVSQWVQKGDFSRLLPEARPMGMYLSLKNLQGQRRYAELLCACKAAIALWEREDTFTILDIYLRMLCATACYELDRVDECDDHLLEAMKIALPNGFVTPFVQSWMTTGYTRENITTLLTQREYRVAQMIVAGSTYQNVADELYLSVGTVKKLVSSLYDKLMIHSRAELADMIM